MSSVEVTPQDIDVTFQAEHELRVDLACLHYYVVLDLVPVTRDVRLERPDASYLHKLGVAADNLIIAAHFLEQYMQADTPGESELDWMAGIEESFLRVGKEARPARRFAFGREFSDRHQPEQRFDFHRAIHALRTIDGDKVFSPFGREIAEEWRAGNIRLPQEFAITPDEAARIPGDGPLKAQLISRLVAQGMI